MKIVQVFAVVLLAISLLACAEGSSNRASNPTFGRYEVSGSSSNSNMAAAAPKSEVSSDKSEQSSSPPIPVERKIIRNADLILESNSPEEAQQKIAAIAQSKGGFVIESQSSNSTSDVTTRDTVTMTLRVPAEKFQESIDEIRKSSSRVVEETVKGQDVTEEFVDVEARLKAKKALEAQFLEIMKQAKTIADSLEVQKQLAEVRGEIEKIEGRKRFLENQSSLSTINVRLQTSAAFSGSSNGFFYQLKEALSDGFSAALTFILVLIRILVALLPFLILIVLPIYLVIRYFVKRSKKQKAADEIVREEIKNE